ncbi:MAG: hypothetical protein WBP31_08670 [Chitinophagales bacterium]
MSKTIAKEEDEIILDPNLVRKLIRMKRALHNWTNQQLIDEFLNKAPYLFEIKSVQDISRFLNGSAPSTFSSKDKIKLQKLVDEVTLEIKLDLEGNEGFAGKPYKVNSNTVEKWMKAAEDSERCIFFNTYIKMKDWHNPIIQMHMCLQKSIEQKSNLVSIHDCHSKKGENHSEKVEEDRIPKIISCTQKPPSYKHYRVLFLPLTTDTYNESVSTKDAFYENLKFSAYQHSALSIQLAVMTVNDLMNFMNHNNYTEFFQKENNLKILGLNKEFASLIKKKEFNQSQVEVFITCLTNMSDIPNRKSETGMDYMLIQREESKTKKDDLWTGVLSTKTGLNYVACEEKKNIEVRREFTQKIFEYITYDGLPSQQETNFSNVDPLYEFNKNKTQKIVKNIFHPLLRTH